jgi:hypothetical protein
MKKTMKTCLALIAAGLILTSCTKTGPVGPAGANGTNGNANVQEQTFNNQVLGFIAANNDYEMNLSMPAITYSCLQTGAVMVYIQNSSSTNTSGWVQLPASIGSVQFNVTDNLGSVNIACTNASTSTYNVKVVVIPQ